MMTEGGCHVLLPAANRLIAMALSGPPSLIIIFQTNRMSPLGHAPMPVLWLW